jgi:hypothetical protein
VENKALDDAEALIRVLEGHHKRHASLGYNGLGEYHLRRTDLPRAIALLRVLVERVRELEKEVEKLTTIARAHAGRVKGCFCERCKEQEYAEAKLYDAGIRVVDGRCESTNNSEGI